MTYEFKCPECGGTRLNEVMVSVTVDSEISRVSTYIVYGHQTNDGGEVAYYCCRNCGIALATDGGVERLSETNAEYVTTIGGLIEWLKAQ